MIRVPLYMHKVATWEVTNTGLTARAAEVPHLETGRAQLEAKLDLFKTLSTQHAVLTTSKQEIGKQMRILFREVETLVDFLRTGIRQHYGKDSEVLIEFGLQPYRGRSSAPKPPAPEAPEPADPAPAPDPAK